MNHVRSILGAAIALMLICGVTVAALAATNLLTKDTIAAAEKEATNEACQAVLPAATSFEMLEGTWQDGVLEVYEGSDGDAVVGYVVKTETVGKSSGLVVMTGVDADGAVGGVQVVSNSETAGYVDTVTEGGLLDRLLGVTGSADTVDGVSQATKTSNGIKNGVSLALATVEEVQGNG